MKKILLLTVLTLTSTMANVFASDLPKCSDPFYNANLSPIGWQCMTKNETVLTHLENNSWKMNGAIWRPVVGEWNNTIDTISSSCNQVGARLPTEAEVRDADKNGLTEVEYLPSYESGGEDQIFLFTSDKDVVYVLNTKYGHEKGVTFFMYDDERMSWATGLCIVKQ